MKLKKIPEMLDKNKKNEKNKNWYEQNWSKLMKILKKKRIIIMDEQS